MNSAPKIEPNDLPITTTISLFLCAIRDKVTDYRLLPQYEESHDILDLAEVEGGGYPSGTSRALKNRKVRDYKKYSTCRAVLEAWDRLPSGEQH